MQLVFQQCGHLDKRRSLLGEGLITFIQIIEMPCHYLNNANGIPSIGSSGHAPVFSWWRGRITFI